MDGCNKPDITILFFAVVSCPSGCRQYFCAQGGAALCIQRCSAVHRRVHNTASRHAQTLLPKNDFFSKECLVFYPATVDEKAVVNLKGMSVFFLLIPCIFILMMSVS